jgi:hypothetical protein
MPLPLVTHWLVLQHKRATITLKDVGGAQAICHLWKNHYGGAKAIIYVVDSSDAERLDTAGDEFQRMLVSATNGHI